MIKLLNGNITDYLYLDSYASKYIYNNKEFFLGIKFKNNEFVITNKNII